MKASKTTIPAKILNMVTRSCWAINRTAGFAVCGWCRLKRYWNIISPLLFSFLFFLKERPTHNKFLLFDEMGDYIPFNFKFYGMLSEHGGDGYSAYKLFPAADKTLITQGLSWPNAVCSAVSGARFQGKELLLFLNSRGFAEHKES